MKLGALALLTAAVGCSGAPAPVKPRNSDGAAAERVLPAVARRAPLDRLAGTPASVVGVVRDLDDATIADAWVCAWQAPEHWARAGGRTPRCTVAGSDGSYRLDALPPVRHVVHASARGFEPAGVAAALRPGEVRSLPSLRLRRGGVQVHGVVRDVRGLPVEGAWVTNHGASPEGIGSSAGAAATRSGADGRFDLWLRRDFRGLFASADGFVEGFAGGGSGIGEMQIVLAPGSSLVGRVLDVASGEALPGARVTVVGEGAAPHNKHHTLAITDGGGRFTVEGLFPGRYRASAVVDGGAGEAGDSWVVGLGETVEVPAIEVRPRASLRAVVAVRGGAPPCAQGQVYLHRSDAARAEIEDIALDGAVLFPALLPGSYDVRVNCGGEAVTPTPAKLTIGATSVEGVVWEVIEGPADGEHVGVEVGGVPSGSIHGQVVDRQGQPVVGAFIAATHGGARGDRTTRSNHAGRFVLLDLPPNDYDVRAGQRPGKSESARPGPYDRVVVDAGKAVEVRLVLVGERGPIHGRVQLPDGTPVAGVLVAAMRVQDGDDPRRLLGWESGELPGFTDIDGRFALGPYFAGSYDVVAYRLGGGTSSTSAVSFERGVTLTIVPGR